MKQQKYILWFKKHEQEDNHETKTNFGFNYNGIDFL